MGYYRRYSRPEKVPASAELEARLQRVNGDLKCHLTDWEKGFMESITEAYSKWDGLTVGQHKTFEKIENKYNPETIAAKSAWTESFDEEKRKTLKLVANYYRTAGYFTQLVAKIDSDPDFVPNESTWGKFVENKYAQKVLAAQKRESNFEAGGFALFRDTFVRTGPGFWGDSNYVPRDKSKRKGRTVLLIKESDRISTDKVWLCCFLDNPIQQWELEERWLKRHR